MGIADSPLRDRVLFVEGVPRSGTTMLTSMLSVHPEIAGVMAESHLFDRGMVPLFDGEGHTARYLSRFLTRDQLADLIRDFSDQMLGAMRDEVKPDARFVMEKSPVPPHRTAERLAMKHDCYPDAWYLHIVRDSTATVRSLLRAPWNALDRAGTERWWRDGVEAIRSVLGDSEHYLELSYEELTGQPRETAAAILQWLGLPQVEGALDTMVAMSKERLSTFGPTVTRSQDTAGAKPGSLMSAGARRLRKATTGATRRLRRRPEGNLIHAMRTGDIELIQRMTATDLVVELRSGAGDFRAEGDAAREALQSIGRALFSPGAVAQAGAGLQDHSTFILSAIDGQGRRKDAAVAIVEGDGSIAHVGIIAAGDLHGREPRQWIPDA